MRPREIDWKKIKKLHLKGKSDMEIAKKLNCSVWSVRYARKIMGLKSSYVGKGKKIDREKVKELVNKGLTNVEIARRLKCHPISISLIRGKLGLKGRIGKHSYLEMYKLVAEEPRFTSELKELGVRDPRVSYIYLKRYKLPIRRYKPIKPRRETGIYPYRCEAIYYTDKNNIKAFFKLFKRYGDYLKNINEVKNAMRIGVI